jgi:tellurite resistance protein TehA-like permease
MPSRRGQFIEYIYRGKMAPVMSSGILSISLYFHDLFTVSMVFYAISIFLFSFILFIYSYIYYKNIHFARGRHDAFLNFTFFSGFGLILSRTYLLNPSDFIGFISFSLDFFCLAGALWLLLHIAGNVRKMVQYSHFSQLNLSVALSVCTISVINSFNFMSGKGSHFYLILPVITYFFSIAVYIAIFAGILKRHTGKFREDEIDGTTWILMGLSALISVVSYAFSAIDLYEFQWLTPLFIAFRLWFWVCSTVLITPVLILSVYRSIHVGKVKFSPSLWSVVFPTAVYSYDTYLTYLNLRVNWLYSFSLVVDLISLSLFLVFLILLLSFSAYRQHLLT